MPAAAETMIANCQTFVTIHAFPKMPQHMIDGPHQIAMQIGQSYKGFLSQSGIPDKDLDTNPNTIPSQVHTWKNKTISATIKQFTIMLHHSSIIPQQQIL